MYKNVAGQQLLVYAWNTVAGAPETGDAANITCYYSLDGAADVQTNDVNPTEIDAVTSQGVYVFDLLQAETNGDLIAFTPASATADVVLDPVFVYTDQMTPAVIALLDAAISTRAPAATALSTATWTAAKAAFLDAAISSRSTLTDAEVWTYVSRTLTAYPGLYAMLANLVCGRCDTDVYARGTVENWYMERYTDLLVTGQALSAPGQPIDLTTYDVRWQTAGATIVKTNAPGGGITMVDAANGLFQFTITAAESLLLPYGELDPGIEHECKIRSAAGVVSLVWDGTLRARPTLIEAF